MSTTSPTKSALAQSLKARLKDVQYPREGDVANAVLIRKAARQAFFDLGSFGTGIVYGSEMINARDVLKKLQPGEQIAAKIVAIDNEDGYIELSLSQADQQKMWQQAKELQESGELVTVKIIGANTGGLIAKVLNLKAFLPISQLSNEHAPAADASDRQKIAEELKKFVGEEINVKILDVNSRTNKLILSERETVATNMKELLASYTVGQEVDAIVSGIADFGVFVKFIDNPDIEGMIHVSELDHKIATNPKDVVKLNDTIRVKIADIKEGRVFLSLKALAPNPWDTLGDRFATGQHVHGEVYKYNPFGAVVNLGGDIQGIIRISEFGGLDEMRHALALGQSYDFEIESVKPDERRILLKLKK